jgi:hypothetical protein
MRVQLDIQSVHLRFHLPGLPVPSAIEKHRNAFAPLVNLSLLSRCRSHAQS